MLCDFVPRCVGSVLLAGRRRADEARTVADLAEDQQALREELECRGLVAFVADGAVLPRSSGVSSRPMGDARPFRSPESLRVTIDLPHRGPTSGMAVPRGVTLIVGGGYHGKSTLLKAIEAGVYNHVAGDGREYVATDATAVKLRAEDGRIVRSVDISLFIDDLPNKADTRHFSTLDASGSTSQAASTIEAVEAGARTFLIDEDTSATNFMVRDALMQAVVGRDHEPITPFVERVRELYERVWHLAIGAGGGQLGVVLPKGRHRATRWTADAALRHHRACQGGLRVVRGRPGARRPRLYPARRRSHPRASCRALRQGEGAVGAATASRSRPTARTSSRWAGSRPTCALWSSWWNPSKRRPWPRWCALLWSGTFSRPAPWPRRWGSFATSWPSAVLQA